MTTDILDAVANIAQQFRAAGLEPPRDIALASEKDGIAFMHAVEGTNKFTFDTSNNGMLKRFVAPHGPVYYRIEFFGIGVTWWDEGRLVRG